MKKMKVKVNHLVIRKDGERRIPRQNKSDVMLLKKVMIPYKS